MVSALLAGLCNDSLYKTVFLKPTVLYRLWSNNVLFNKTLLYVCQMLKSVEVASERFPSK